MNDKISWIYPFPLYLSGFSKQKTLCYPDLHGIATALCSEHQRVAISTDR